MGPAKGKSLGTAIWVGAIVRGAEGSLMQLHRHL